MTEKCTATSYKNIKFKTKHETKMFKEKIWFNALKLTFQLQKKSSSVGCPKKFNYKFSY